MYSQRRCLFRFQSRAASRVHDAGIRSQWSSAASNGCPTPNLSCLVRLGLATLHSACACVVRAEFSTLTPAQRAGGATALEGPDGGSQPAATAAGAYQKVGRSIRAAALADRAQNLASCRHPPRWRDQRCAYHGLPNRQVVQDRAARRTPGAARRARSCCGWKHDGCPGARICAAMHRQSSHNAPGSAATVLGASLARATLLSAAPHSWCAACASLVVIHVAGRHWPSRSSFRRLARAGLLYARSASMA